MQMAYAWHTGPGRIELRYLGSRGQQRRFFHVAVHGRRAGPERCADQPAARLVRARDHRPVRRGVPRAIRSPIAWSCSPARGRSCRRFDPDYPVDAPAPLRARRRRPAGDRRRRRAAAAVRPGARRCRRIGADDLSSMSASISCISIRSCSSSIAAWKSGSRAVRSLDAVVLAERVSGVGSFAHALAFCQAVEQAPGAGCRCVRCCCARCSPSSSGSTTTSTILAISPHTTTLKVGEAEGKLLEERAKQINGRLTGSRFLRSLLIPGGLRRDLDPKPWLGARAGAPAREIATYTAMLESTNSHLDRLITTGVLAARGSLRPGRDRADPARLRLRPRSAPRPSLRRLIAALPLDRAGAGRAATRMPARRSALPKSMPAST